MNNKKIFVACDTSNLKEIKKIIHFKMSKEMFKKLNNDE